MRSTLDDRSKLNQKIGSAENYSWKVSSDLFGDVGCDIHDFEPYNYTYFLDNVKSIEDLLKGLCQLSPLADDALKVAERMNQQDFYEFKSALAYERRQEDSRLPNKYDALVIPKWFIPAISIADKCKMPLGAALIRVIKYE